MHRNNVTVLTQNTIGEEVNKQ